MKHVDRMHGILPKTAVGRRWAVDRHYRLLMTATAGLVVNLLYALYNGVLGLMTQSLWFVTMGAYYIVLSAMRFAAVLAGRRGMRTAGDAGALIIRLSGVLLVILAAVLSGSVYLSLTREVAVGYQKIVMITIAAYTFSKLTVAIVGAVKARRTRSPLLTAIRNIGCADAAASLLSLQRSMFASFGDVGSGAGTFIMNAAAGGAVCLFIVGLGVRMAVAGDKNYSDGGDTAHGDIQAGESQ